MVKCHAHRELHLNRKEARRIMAERLEDLILGPDSSLARRKEKTRKQTDRRWRRVKALAREAEEAQTAPKEAADTPSKK
jgi:hypothetical protein